MPLSLITYFQLHLFIDSIMKHHKIFNYFLVLTTVKEYNVSSTPFSFCKGLSHPLSPPPISLFPSDHLLPSYPPPSRSLSCSLSLLLSLLLALPLALTPPCLSLLLSHSLSLALSCSNSCSLPLSPYPSWSPTLSRSLSLSLTYSLSLSLPLSLTLSFSLSLFLSLALTFSDSTQVVTAVHCQRHTIQKTVSPHFLPLLQLLPPSNPFSHDVPRSILDFRGVHIFVSFDK